MNPLTVFLLGLAGGLLGGLYMSWALGTTSRRR
jgi:hypothetical protein